MAVAPSHHADAHAVVELLYRRHAPALRAFCARQAGPDDADEVVQATFVRVLRAVGRGERPRSERAWLLTIARNVCASRATAAVKRHEVLVPAAIDAAATPEVERGLDPELESALAALPEGQRRAFVLRAVHGLSYDEIARELGASRPAVESWIFRARRRLSCAIAERRRRLALDLSSALGAAKSFLAGSAMKAAAVAVVGGSALALGPAAPAPTPEPRATAERPAPTVAVARSAPVAADQSERSSSTRRVDDAAPRAGSKPAPPAALAAPAADAGRAPGSPQAPSTSAPAPGAPDLPTVELLELPAPQPELPAPLPEPSVAVPAAPTLPLPPLESPSTAADATQVVAPLVP